MDAPLLEQEDVLWARVIARDRAADGTFVYAVRSTGVYCRPSCPSRRPLRANVRFFAEAQAAEREGFRACRRCQPDALQDDQSEAIRRVREYIEAHLDEDLSLAALSQVAYLSPTHLQRTFKRITGVTPRQYVEAQRRERFKRHLREGSTVTDALYQAGYRSSSSLYEHVPAQLGMTPSAYQRGGQGMTISYTTVACSLGRLLVAATERGLCAVYFGESDAALVAALEREYPAAVRVERGDGLSDYVRIILNTLDGQDAEPDSVPLAQLPLDIVGTPFQRRVWEALRTIPSGQTHSYAEVAQIIGQPAATRAVAQACASNPVALVIPCHRVRKTDGAVGGYRWGPERKRTLLASEGARTR
ncbi:MAG TPA: bifunctional DNA-binding transcriptional regulator/O6-methylguanine-DNA methyltransferase Ada [Ktedonobacterales bacterium]